MAKTAEQRVALVTGAASGIGFATAVTLSKAGWRIAAIDRDATALAALGAEILGPKRLQIYSADVCSEEAVDRTVADVVRHFGRLDGVVNSAGIAADIPAQPFDLMAFYPGVPTASVLVTRVPVARVITFPASLTGSYAKARVAATAQTDFDVQKNGVSAATIRFAAAGTVATFIAASSIVTAAGDLISIHGPASADATIADIGFCLSGTR